MKYLPALAGLLSLLACALWIASLCGPWYRIHDGTQQHMGLYKSYETGQGHEKHEYEQQHNMFEDATGITAAREEQLVGKHTHVDDEYQHEHDHKHEEKNKHHHHKHGHENEEEEMEHENKGLPTLQPIIIQPTQPDNINRPTTSAPLAPEPTGSGDLEFGGGGSGGGGFGGGGGWTMRPTPGPTAVPAGPSEPVATPVPTSKHGRVYRQPGRKHEHEEHEHEHDHKHKHKHDEDKEQYQHVSLNQVDAGNIPETSQGQGQGATQGTQQGYGQGRHMKKHGTKHEIKKSNELPYDETWVKVMRVLLILAIIVSAIAALLQLIMAWTVGETAYKGSWMTSPTTALVTTTLITLAALHGLIVYLLFMSKRDQLPYHHGHYDYANTLNLVATGLSFLSPLLFWYTLDPYAKHESLLGEETMTGRRKYASVE